MQLDLRITNFDEFDTMVQSVISKPWASKNGAYGHDRIHEALVRQCEWQLGMDDNYFDESQDPNPHCQIPLGTEYDKVYCFNCVSHKKDGVKHIIRLQYVGTIK